MKTVPKCPVCGEGMVFTFAFPYMEYACLPCNQVDEFFPRNERIEVSDEEHDAKKKLWAADLNKIALLEGGAHCEKCDRAMSCDDCKKTLAHEYEFYCKGNVAPAPQDIITNTQAP